ncbi:hypothetical protein Y1Q_0015707 [Alligator mississippiensis]|uniref:Uncharacterized protein n=1 Tax=Alligator mississippiensis TaxID=8496 RepID=A0A151NNV9_ALLMI|nr:hypothetical protein Y1Q_0015707 [Alligator mississippiensis]
MFSFQQWDYVVLDMKDNVQSTEESYKIQDLSLVTDIRHNTTKHKKGTRIHCIPPSAYIVDDKMVKHCAYSLTVLKHAQNPPTCPEVAKGPFDYYVGPAEVDIFKAASAIGVTLAEEFRQLN